MYVFIVTLHVILCLFLVLIILMQPGKGGDISSAFGGGSSSQLFGAAGPGNFLTRGTGLIAGLFMFTSIALAMYSGAPTTGDEDDIQRILQEGEEGEGFGAASGATAPPATAPTAPAVPATAPAASPPADPGAADAAPAAGGSAPSPAAPAGAPPAGASTP
jgi:preprotein translocase subunit SecG